MRPTCNDVDEPGVSVSDYPDNVPRVQSRVADVSLGRESLTFPRIRRKQWRKQELLQYWLRFPTQHTQ